MRVAFAVSDCAVQTGAAGRYPAIQANGQHHTSYRLITVAASIEERKLGFHDLRGETRVRLGRSLC
jgi:hypothetical protein